MDKGRVELLLKSAMLFLKRCKMSLNGHVAVPSFCLHPVRKCRMFQVVTQQVCHGIFHLSKAK